MAAQLELTILSQCVVGRIHTSSKELEVQGKRISYSQLVLAVGADPKRPKIDGPAGGELLCINDLDDYARYRQKLESCRSVVILGAGLIGVEFANDLVAAKFEVSLVDPAPVPLSRLLHPDAGSEFANALSAEGINLQLGRSVRHVDYSKLGYSLTLDDGVTLYADLIVSAIGLAPRASLAKAAGLDTREGIVTDAYCRTSAPDIFAVGDCAEIHGKVQPYVLPLMHSARALAATLCGRPTPVEYPVMPVVVKTPAIPTIIAGTADASGRWSIEAIDTPNGKGLKALCTDLTNGQLKHFSLLGGAISEKTALLGTMSAQHVRT